MRRSRGVTVLFVGHRAAALVEPASTTCRAWRGSSPGLASDFRLGVLTNTHAVQLVLDHLTAMGEMASLDAVVTSVELGWRKPHPSTYRAALAALGTTAADTVFVGDTRDTRDADDDGPRGVGMPAFLIDTGGVHDIDESHRLTDVFDLSARLARTNGPAR